MSHSEFNMKAKFTGHGRSFQQSLGERKNERKKERKRERKKERKREKKATQRQPQTKEQELVYPCYYLFVFISHWSTAVYSLLHTTEWSRLVNCCSDIS